MRSGVMAPRFFTLLGSTASHPEGRSFSVQLDGVVVGAVFFFVRASCKFPEQAHRLPLRPKWVGLRWSDDSLIFFLTCIFFLSDFAPRHAPSASTFLLRVFLIFKVSRHMEDTTPCRLSQGASFQHQVFFFFFFLLLFFFFSPRPSGVFPVEYDCSASFLAPSAEACHAKLSREPRSCGRVCMKYVYVLHIQPQAGRSGSR